MRDQGDHRPAEPAAATRAAAHLAGPLHVAVPDGGRAARRVAAALEPLRSGGLAVRLVDATGDAMACDLVLVGSGGGTDSTATTTLVRVQAGLDDREAELAEQLAKLAGTP